MEGDRCDGDEDQGGGGGRDGVSAGVAVVYRNDDLDGRLVAGSRLGGTAAGQTLTMDVGSSSNGSLAVVEMWWRCGGDQLGGGVGGESDVGDCTRYTNLLP